MPRPKGPEAPHGRDENGIPLAPYGLKVDGTPKLSARGATAGGFGNKSAAGASRASASVKSLTDRERKGMLCDLADSFLVTPLAKASQAKPIIDRLGPKQADALAGDAYVASQYIPPLADALIVFSKSRPGVLAWMDKAEENAPWLMLMQVAVQAGTAFVQNHINPNPAWAAAGRNYVNVRLTAMADEINRQANAAKAQQENERSWAADADELTEQFAAVG